MTLTFTLLSGRCGGSPKPWREIDETQVERSPAVTMEEAPRWT
ncbi:MAG: hypothetical protein M0Z46_20500 [Actinomycetota bacterium]|jgi:hypothetical protein|nr:hypothetical protein [Actinomycetota bacterium]